MNSFISLPLIRLLLWFSAGLCLAELTGPVSLPVWSIPVILLTLATGYFNFSATTHVAFAYRWLPGVMIAGLYLGSGVIIFSVNMPASNPLHLACQDIPIDCLLGRIAEPPQPGKKSVRFTLNVFAIRSQNEWEKVTGKIMVYGKPDILTDGFGYGDTLLIEACPKPIPVPHNPGQFDYKRFLARRSIYHQVYLNDTNFRLMGTNHQWDIKRLAFLARSTLSDILAESGLKDKESGIAQALLLGDKSQLDDETYQSFSSSGTIHILCVSGMHVGTIYLVLSFLLRFLPNKQWSNGLRILLIILLIWFYSFLTGLSASVLRAAVMFSILLAGTLFRRPTNIYNTLAASAFILLIFNPSLMHDTGFQLSYLAVIGIVSLHPWINDRVTLKAWLPSRIWSLLSVSAAAQILTVPLTVHLFHQFPNYFLLANLLVVPLSAFVIYAGILVFVTYPFPFLWKGICIVFSCLVELMSKIVRCVEGLPYSTSYGLSVDDFQMVILYGMIITGMVFIFRRNGMALLGLLSLAVLLQMYGLLRISRIRDQKQVVVYAIPGSTSVGFIQGTQGIMLMDSSLVNDNRRIKMNMNEHWLQVGLKKIHHHSLHDCPTLQYNWVHSHESDLMSYFQMEDRSMAIIDQRVNLVRHRAGKLKVDYVLICNNAPVDLKDLTTHMDISCLLIDLSNSRWKVKQWREQADALNLPFHDLNERGAFVTSWK